MKIERKEIEDVTVIKVIGQVRISTQEEFKSLLEGLLNEDISKVIISMDGIIYMNSAGLGIVIDIYKKFKEANKSLIFCNLMPEIRKLFEVTRVNRFVKICDSQEIALKEINA